MQSLLTGQLYLLKDQELMLSKLTTFINERDSMYKEVKSYCQDKSIPLEDRWKVYSVSGMGETMNWIWSFESFNEDEFHSNGGRSRHEMCDPGDVMEYFKYKLEYSDEDHYNNEVLLFKEEVLQAFVSSWELDW